MSEVAAQLKSAHLDMLQHMLMPQKVGYGKTGTLTGDCVYCRILYAGSRMQSNALRVRVDDPEDWTLGDDDAVVEYLLTRTGC